MDDLITLRDGSKVSDRRLDRLVQFDERSRQYPIRQLLDTTKPIRSYTWSCPVWLDQGREGACVGFSLTQKMAARYPMIKNASNELAQRLYKRAQELDEWTGEDYEGTSVLGGNKAAVEAGYIKGYYWAFTLQEALLAIAYSGGGVMGINWYSGMMRPDASGFIYPTGNVAGGHAIFARGGKFYPIAGAPAAWSKLPNWIDYLDQERSFIRLRNSWGNDWGIGGDCLLTVRDFARLLSEAGEFTVLIRK